MFDPNRPAAPSRFEVIRLALQEIGSPGPERILEYHSNAFGKPHAGRELQWCGLFCLSMLHDAGIAKDVFWKIGGGFCEEQKLTKVKLPEPGDVVYYHLPFQHHALVHSVDEAAGTYATVDGNQAADTVVLRTKIPLTKATCFYSIEKMLRAATEDEP